MSQINADAIDLLELIGSYSRITWNRLVAVIAENEGRRSNALAERLAACVKVLKSVIDELRVDVECDLSYEDKNPSGMSALRSIENADRFIKKCYPEDEWDEMSRAFLDLNDTFPKVFDRLLPELLAMLRGDAALQRFKAPIMTEFSRELDHLTYHFETDFIDRSLFSAEWIPDSEQ
jgi:hypothetical protein